MPDVDLKAVGLVKWSKNSCTAYYVNAQVDEERTRSELVRVLRFAVEARTVGIQGDLAIDFEPAIRERRFLIHCLAKDLALTSASVGGSEEKFVRVSHAAKPGLEEKLEERLSIKAEGSLAGTCPLGLEAKHLGP